MYISFFGLNENPFNLTPDPRFLFLSPSHKEALSHLLYGINERKGFIAITGGIGTGKTTLCRALLSHLGASTKSALIFNSFISDTDLLKIIIQEFAIEMDPAKAGKKDYIDALNHFLLETFSSGGNSVLLIDEAQNLSRTTLEQIRMLSNLETESEKLIQIVLAGQPELKDVLAAPSLKQLNERIMVRYDLKPLQPKDVRGYLEHRLIVAQGTGNSRFTNRAVKKIFNYSKGNPRRINAACDRALLIAYTKEKQTISAGIIGEAVTDLSSGAIMDRFAAGLLWSRIRPVGLILLLPVLLICIYLWSSRGPVSGPPVSKLETEAIKSRHISSESIEPEKKSSALFLDEKVGLAFLIGLFNEERAGKGLITAVSQLGLIMFDLGPEYYPLLKRPFLVYLSYPPLSSSPAPRCLLIRKATEDGAVAVDSENRDYPITRDFIRRHWSGKVAWVYSYKIKSIHLMKGMSVPEVIRVQEILDHTGYPTSPTGIYDDLTFRQVVRFQKDFGLNVDGIVGPRTRALLYQMTELK